jgi:hypothetical protein
MAYGRLLVGNGHAAGAITDLAAGAGAAWVALSLLSVLASVFVSGLASALASGLASG